jgi:NAD(P)H-nitrite reductase large subunit
MWQPDRGDVERIVVVGASVAGVNAVDTLREAGFRGALTLVGEESHRPYDRPPLVRTAVERHSPPTALRPLGWYQEHDVTLLLDQTASQLDATNGQVVLADGRRVPYDGLVIATGSRAKTAVDGAQHVLSVRRLGQAREIARRLDEVRRVAVIGAGFLGLELAAALRGHGCAVQVVEVAPAPLARVLGDEIGTWFLDLHERNGVRVRCETLATAVEKTGPAYRVHLHDGSTIDADMVVGAMGATPAEAWLRGSGVKVADGVMCDERLRTSVPEVVAAGDVARWYNPLFDEVMRVEQWTNAVEQGRHAALSLLGSQAPYEPVPYMWSDQFDARMRFVGVANAVVDVQIDHMSSRTLSARYVRDGVQVGGLCINASSQLARHRARIKGRMP